MPEIMNQVANSRSRSRSRSYSRSPPRKSYGSSSMNGRRTPDKRRRSRSRSFRSGSRPSVAISKKNHRSYSRSRSRSYSPNMYNSRRRSPSRSPYSSRSRRPYHGANRDKPQQSRCLGIFGLNIVTDEHNIREIFSKFGPIDRVQLVIDAKTGRSRGFCFVYFANMHDAKAAKDECSGMEIDGRRIRVDYSITQRAHTPTPGVYMGRSTREEHSHRRRSPSPYRDRRRRYERSRSRSYSPRRHR